MTNGHSERHFVATSPKNRYLCVMRTDQLQFRPAAEADIDRILEIIRGAQARMRARGSSQWQNGYPAVADITRDIERGCGYLLAEPGKGPTAAYGAVIFEGEPAYEAIEGEWLTQGPYVMVHRLAVAGEQLRRGVAREFMHRVEALALARGIGSFRVDTNFDNAGMLALLAEAGFVRCGEIRYGTEHREAFEKVLSDK